MTRLALPPHLVSEVENGNVVLMLGAGASLGARNAKGEGPPGAKTLAQMIARKFLNDDYAVLPLNQVSEYAINETDLFTVQAYIASIFDGLNPTDAHTRLTTFRWRGLATTNYDTVVEEAYQRTRLPAQKLVPFIDNTDRTDDKMRGTNSLMYLKLHGCSTRTNDAQCPLILTTDQYVSYRRGRSRLFSNFMEWACERPVLFVGYGLQDPDLRAILQEIDVHVPSRPRGYLVSPGVGEIEKRYWEKKNITAIAGTFDELSYALDNAIASTFRGLKSSAETGNLAIKGRFTRFDASLSANTLQFLENDVDYVKTVTSAEKIDPLLFYKGANGEWSAIEQDLDVHRRLMDTILVDHVIDEETAAKTVPTLIVIKAHAGAGKTVLLNRLAWEAARTYDKVCVKIRPNGLINGAALAELCDLTNDHILVVVDSIIDRRREVENLFSPRSVLLGKVTIITAARTNEWNQAPESLTSLATFEHDLPYLSRKEIDELLERLAKHKALGTLESLSVNQRQEALHEKAGRQLLVALHEATLGKPFEEIIKDEYERISPMKAQRMYLTVCLLNQFAVPVRAGIISRMYGVPIEEFRKSFFAPLENIIITTYDKTSGDYCYIARHAHIAEIVVQTVLLNKEDLFNEIVQVIQYLNPSYSSDRTAFNRLLQGRALLNLFPDHQMVAQIYETARTVGGDDPYLMQQMCIYEMMRPSGNLVVADSLIKKALELTGNRPTILHTQAEVYVRRGENARLALEKRKYLNEATTICEQLKSKMAEAYPYYTLVKIGIIQIKESLMAEEIDDDQVEALIKKTETHLSDGIMRFPDNAHMSSAEAELANVLKEFERVIEAMERSFNLNNRNAFIATRLAAHYVNKNNIAQALEILKKALDARRDNAKLHFFYGKTLVEHNGSNDESLYHLARGYTPGDANLEAQFLHARQLFIMGQRQESKELFRKLSSMRMSPNARNSLRYPLEPVFYGTVKRIEAGYSIISRDGDDEWIFMSRNDVPPNVWDRLSYSMRVAFKIAFSMRGTRAFEVSIQ